MASTIPINRTIVVKALVTSKRNGEVRIIDGIEVLGLDKFQSPEFRQYDEGTILECHFSLSSDNNFKSLVFTKRAPAGTKIDSRIIEENKPKYDIIPEWINGHYYDQEMREFFGMATFMLNRNEFINVIMRGNSGYGKTTAFKTFAEHIKFDFLKVDCATITDPEAWFGIRQARDGSTMFERSQFGEKIVTGRCVILFDEANRLESWLANTLFPILDDSKEVIVAGQVFTIKPPIMFAMTINEGAQFSGTFNLDAALRNRADIALIAKPLPREIEQQLIMDQFKLSATQAQRIIGAVNAMRQAVEKDNLFMDVSTRTTLKVARIVSLGTTIEQAFKMVLVNAVDQEEVKPIIDIIKAI